MYKTSNIKYLLIHNSLFKNVIFLTKEYKMYLIILQKLRCLIAFQNRPSAPMTDIFWISNSSKDNFVKKSLPLSNRRKLSIILNFSFPSASFSGVFLTWKCKYRLVNQCLDQSSLQCRHFLWARNFTRESAMLKLHEERRKWGVSKGARRGRGRAVREKRKRRIFFSPPPLPFSFFRPRTHRKGYYFYSPQSSTVIKSKMAATTTLWTRTRFCPPKIRLHCRLRAVSLLKIFVYASHFRLDHVTRNALAARNNEA